MTSLIPRLSVAVEGSRELDAAIAVAIFETISEPEDLIYAIEVRSYDECAPGTFWRKSRSGLSLQTAPNYTTSVDVAFALVPEGLPAMVQRNVNGERHSALVGRMSKLEGRDTLVRGDGATPALAICIAALRARQSEKG